MLLGLAPWEAAGSATASGLAADFSEFAAAGDSAVGLAGAVGLVSVADGWVTFSALEEASSDEEVAPFSTGAAAASLASVVEGWLACSVLEAADSEEAGAAFSTVAGVAGWLSGVAAWEADSVADTTAAVGWLCPDELAVVCSSAWACPAPKTRAVPSRTEAKPNLYLRSEKRCLCIEVSLLYL